MGGGYSNEATLYGSTVAGGYSNSATTGNYVTVGGGYSNDASATGATIAGGYNNTASNTYVAVGGGYGNSASGSYATIPGGSSNSASGSYATVAGGYSNTASGSYSFAAGYHANASYNGCFSLADASTTSNLSCTTTNQFVARAANGYTFYTNSALTAGVAVGAGGSAWAPVSDRNLKFDFAEINPREVLAKVAAMPMSTWKYKAEVSRATHMGPMAQDFYAAFALGDDDRHISTIDSDGVALAAIKGLHEITKELTDQNAALKADIEKEHAGNATLRDENRALHTQLDELKARVDTIEKATKLPSKSGVPLEQLALLGLVAAAGAAVASMRSK